MHRFPLACLLSTFGASLAAQFAPPNDECANAILVANGSHGPFTNVGASSSAPAWGCSTGCCDVWFLYLAGSSGTLSVDTCWAPFDTMIEVFDGTGSCGALTSVGCNDDSMTCGLGSSALSVAVVPGPYFIRVGGYAGIPPTHPTGTFTLNVNGPYGAGAMAWNTPVGAGCGDRYGSIYELFDTLNPFDLANTTLTWQRTNAGYVVTRSAGVQIVPPTAAAAAITTQQSFTLPAPMPVPGGSVSSVNVTRYGQVELGGAASSFPNNQPSPLYLLQQTTSVFACWQDVDPTFGLVTFEVVAGTAYATWNVGAYGAVAPSNFQFQLDLATGDVRLAIVDIPAHWMAMAPLNCLIGYSPAGYSADPGARDLSSSSPVTLTTGAEVPPLQLGATTRPSLGTTWSLTMSNVPASAVVGFDVFGLADPGVNDLAAIGMPGCGLRSALDVVLTWPTAGTSHTYSLQIPNTPSLAGARLHTTSAVLTNPPENALGIITANGVEGLLGTL